MGETRLMLGDCLKVLPTLADASVDSIVTDPPYGLKFMGKNWDHGIPGIPFWQAALRVLKPGHYMLCFGGTRTYHRLACAVEDAGWEIRDCINWLYGSGFPKGRGCLKPAWEPILLARKPGPKVLPLQIDACRVGTTDNLNGGAYAQSGTNRDDGWGMQRAGAGEFVQPIGRWPANVIHSGEPEVMEAFAAFGERHAYGPYRGSESRPTKANCYGEWKDGKGQGPVYADSGSAARFFYCAKASKRDRNEGCDGLPFGKPPESGRRSVPAEGRKSALGQPRPNTHPTVKPTALMRYLCRLITPPGGTVLDPFMGSGSTGKAARQEGFGFIGIEQDAKYMAIARKRARKQVLA